MEAISVTSKRQVTIPITKLEVSLRPMAKRRRQRRSLRHVTYDRGGTTNQPMPLRRLRQRQGDQRQQAKEGIVCRSQGAYHGRFPNPAKRHAKSRLATSKFTKILGDDLL